MIRNSLTGKQKSFLRSMGMKLEPVVQIGKEGVTPSVVQAAREAIKKRELIKVRVPSDDREELESIYAEVAEKLGADIEMVRVGIGSDPRIGTQFLYPGVGYGGSCFPKDVKALIKTAEQNGYTMRVLTAVEEVNENQKSVLFEKLMKQFNGDLQGKTVALWGLAFKPETDDMRETPALVLIDKLLKAGCKVRAYDPAAVQECKRRIGDTIYYACDMYDAVLDADVLMLVTEWKEFRLPSWAVIKKTMSRQIVLDGRNIYDKKEMEELGFIYHCIGK